MLGKAKMPELKVLLTAYTKEGEAPRLGGDKSALQERVVEAVRAAGTAGFVRAPVFASE